MRRELKGQLRDWRKTNIAWVLRCTCIGANDGASYDDPRALARATLGHGEWTDGCL
jgi:hypothetical protein